MKKSDWKLTDFQVVNVVGLGLALSGALHLFITTGFLPFSVAILGTLLLGSMLLAAFHQDLGNIVSWAGLVLLLLGIGLGVLFSILTSPFWVAILGTGILIFVGLKPN